MLCPKDERGARRWDGRCPDCDGCIDDRCWGCGVRFCGGTYSWFQGASDAPEDQACNRCPEKVDWMIRDDKGRERMIMVRCNGDTGHTGGHSPNPRTVGY